MVSPNFVAGLPLSGWIYRANGMNLILSETLNKLQIVYMAYAIQLMMIIQFSANM
jgi:hypothetical protein